jgi:hypothetical protein
MVVAGKVGFLLREKLTEFKCGPGFAKLFSGEKDLAKPRQIFSVGNLDLVSRAEEGSGEESARAFWAG